MNDGSRPPMARRRRWTAVIVLLLSAASLLYLFFMPGILLYGSAWLPGFLLALLAAAIGTPMMLTARERTPLCRIAAGSAWLALVLHLLILTPLAVRLFGV